MRNSEAAKPGSDGCREYRAEGQGPGAASPWACGWGGRSLLRPLLLLLLCLCCCLPGIPLGFLGSIACSLWVLARRSPFTKVSPNHLTDYYNKQLLHPILTTHTHISLALFSFFKSIALNTYQRLYHLYICKTYYNLSFLHENSLRAESLIYIVLWRIPCTHNSV